MPEVFTNYTLFFFLYSFLGWALEFLYSGIADGKFTNKGFLLSPQSPLYGSGAMIILLTSKGTDSLFEFGLSASLIITSILSATFITVLEYLTALFHEKAFGLKLWDYSDEAFNLQGRICLKYSLLWGGLAIILLTIVQPFIEHYLWPIPFGIRAAVMLVLCICLAADTGFSVRQRILN